MKFVGDIYSLNSAGCLVGDDLLTELWCAGFGVKLFVYEQDVNAGLESLDGQGRVPDMPLMLRFAAMQANYRNELRFKQSPLKRHGKGRK